MKRLYVYILTNRRNGTLYVGVTNDLARRIDEHRTHQVSGFSSKHKLSRLVYFEVFDDTVEAISREKQVKRWKRSWKLALIESINPYWNDLSAEIEW